MTETEKQKNIAQAAFQVFAERGFRKTSMQLIADQAGMSRPALYLHFQSKEDVFNYLVLGYLGKVESTILSRLSKPGRPEQVLTDVFAAFDPDGLKAVLLDAKHGDELMDIKNGAVQSRADQIARNIRSALSTWLAAEALAGHVNCDDPGVTAQVIMSAYNGLKTPRPSYMEYKARRATLAALLGQGLEA